MLRQRAAGESGAVRWVRRAAGFNGVFLKRLSYAFPTPLNPQCCKARLHGGHSVHDMGLTSSQDARILWLHMNASNMRSRRVCTAGKHCCSACKTGSRPGYGVVKHSCGRHQDLSLCTRCSKALDFTHMLQVLQVREQSRSALLGGTAALPAKSGHNRVTVS